MRISDWSSDVCSSDLKETAVPAERRTVAGVYTNRLGVGMRLQADPTIIYPVTKGKPLGRRILRSEIQAVNGYNTYSMAGLPKGPIANPGRASIAAVLDPEENDYLFRSEEHKSELHSLMRNTNAVVC